MRQGPEGHAIRRPQAVLMRPEKMLTQKSPEAARRFRDRDALHAMRREEERRIVSPDNPASAVLSDGAWRGQPCFIIGGGPSLKGFDFERLRGRGRIIVINKGFTHVPFADILFFMDHASFYMKLNRGLFGDAATRAWKEFQGVKVFLNLRGRQVDADVRSIRSLGRSGLSLSLRRGLCHGNNSGYGAIGLAACMRANPIYLLGYDMRYVGNVTHFHGGYNYRQPERSLRAYAIEIAKLAVPLARAGFTVVNLNRSSNLKAYPFGDIEEVLK